ncbi:DNA adenine methylase [Rhodopseudomonas palustris]|uniref:DNA adenine methylase n=1 Tax=Rhodopseudomonas palustris TaxID=1076 RepID=UPI000641C60F|nr:DNA adenine methylase [Rhodopseudomonas palustris]
MPWCTRTDVSPLRYPGGKRKLAPFIADLIRRAELDIELLVEPFAGGAAVAISLLESGHVKSIGLADADPLIASFWRIVFSDDAWKLVDLIQDTKVTLGEWYRQKALAPRCDLSAAFKCLYLNRTSFSGALMSRTGPIGGISQKGPYKIGCRFNRPKIAARILELSKLADNVRFVRNSSYRRTMADVSRTSLAAQSPEKILWYLDPPFFAKAERLYRYSFSDDQHEELPDDIDNLVGHWLLSYDDHATARRLYSKHPGFARVNLRYNARIDTTERLVASEVIVSDLIASLRKRSLLDDWGKVIQLPRRRQPALPGTASRSVVKAAR